MRRWGRWVWVAWLLAIAASFALFEGLAVTNDGLTLSRFIYDLNQAWPLIGVLFGVLMGGLAVHFFWNWDPASRQRIAVLEAELRQAREHNRRLEAALSRNRGNR